MTADDNLDRGVKFKYNSSGAKVGSDPMTVLYKVLSLFMQLIPETVKAGGVKFGAIDRSNHLVMVH